MSPTLYVKFSFMAYIFHRTNSVQHSAALQGKPYRQSHRCFQKLNVKEIVLRAGARVQTECEA